MFRLCVCILSFAALSMAERSPEEWLLPRAANQFTTKMFTEVVKDEAGKSVVISAFSVMPLLAQLGLASVGESHDELLQSIGMRNDNATKAAFSELNTRLKSIKDFELRMANKIYIDKNYELNKDFAAVSKDVFNFEVQNVDFEKNTESAQEINSWVQNQTNHRIKDLVSPDMLSSDTRAVLVNAIYFKGRWEYPFYKLAIIDRDFHVSNDKVIKVPTMHAQNHYKYVDSKDINAQVIELRYVGKSASMILVLPRSIDGINDLERTLSDPRRLSSILNSMGLTYMDVYLPKFKIESTTNLKKILQNMNVKRVFSPEQAKLYNLIKDTHDIHVSDAVQKAFIEVDEEGVDAAAANLPPLALTSCHHVFAANRPFLFYIYDRGDILFNGAYYA